MSDPGFGEEYADTSVSADLRETLRTWEMVRAPRPPAFTAIRSVLRADRSPIAAQRWSKRHGLRLGSALAFAQLRVVPWLVFPVALGAATIAVFTARFLGLSYGQSAAVSGFAISILLGATVAATIAFSATEADAVSLATPVGPQLVALARIGIVLALECAAGAAASSLATALGHTSDFAALLNAWLAPLTAVTAIAALATSWLAPWLGLLLSGAFIPLVTPAATSTMVVGAGTLSGVLWDALQPLGVVLLGALTLAVTVTTARPAMSRNVGSRIAD